MTAEQRDVCRWTWDDGDSLWRTTCGTWYPFGKDATDHCKHCPECTKRIRTVVAEEE